MDSYSFPVQVRLDLYTKEGTAGRRRSARAGHRSARSLVNTFIRSTDPRICIHVLWTELLQYAVRDLLFPAMEHYSGRESKCARLPLPSFAFDVDLRRLSGTRGDHGDSAHRYCRSYSKSEASRGTVRSSLGRAEAEQSTEPSADANAHHDGWKDRRVSALYPSLRHVQSYHATKCERGHFDLSLKQHSNRIRLVPQSQLRRKSRLRSECNRLVCSFPDELLHPLPQFQPLPQGIHPANQTSTSTKSPLGQSSRSTKTNRLRTNESSFLSERSFALHIFSAMKIDRQTCSCTLAVDEFLLIRHRSILYSTQKRCSHSASSVLI